MWRGHLALVLWRRQDAGGTQGRDGLATDRINIRLPYYFIHQRSININYPAATGKLARQIDPLGSLESIFDEPLNHRFRRDLPFNFQLKAARLHRFGLRYRVTKRLFEVPAK